jgi:hypothetical protein
MRGAQLDGVSLVEVLKPVVMGQDPLERERLYHALRGTPRRQLAQQRGEPPRHHGHPELRVLRGADAGGAQKHGLVEDIEGTCKLCQRVGRPQEAQGHFTNAVTMYREMGMGFWLEKAEAELGPPHRNSS